MNGSTAANAGVGRSAGACAAALTATAGCARKAPSCAAVHPPTSTAPTAAIAKAFFPTLASDPFMPTRSSLMRRSAVSCHSEPSPPQAGR